MRFQVRLELVLDRVDETGRSVDTDILSRPTNALNVEAGKVVHMPMRDKDVAGAQELARSEPAEIAEIEKQSALLEYQIHVKPGIVEGIVDQRRIEVTRHGAAYIGIETL
jgi:hypothetical protein